MNLRYVHRKRNPVPRVHLSPQVLDVVVGELPLPRAEVLSDVAQLVHLAVQLHQSEMQRQSSDQSAEETGGFVSRVPGFFAAQKTCQVEQQSRNEMVQQSLHGDDFVVGGGVEDHVPHCVYRRRPVSVQLADGVVFVKCDGVVDRRYVIVDGNITRFPAIIHFNKCARVSINSIRD